MAHPALHNSVSSHRPSISELENTIRECDAESQALVSFAGDLRSRIIRYQDKVQQCDDLWKKMKEDNQGSYRAINETISRLQNAELVEKTLLRDAHRFAQEQDPRRQRQPTNGIQPVVESQTLVRFETPETPRRPVSPLESDTINNPAALPIVAPSAAPSAVPSAVPSVALAAVPMTAPTMASTTALDPTESRQFGGIIKRRVSDTASQPPRPTKRQNASNPDNPTTTTTTTAAATTMNSTADTFIPAGYISFDQVYQNSQAENKCHIIEYTFKHPTSGIEAIFWILRCLSCSSTGADYYFALPTVVDKQVLSSAGTHNRLHHSLSQKHRVCLQTLGVPVWGCTTELAAKNNNAIVKAFKEEGYMSQAADPKKWEDPFKHHPREIPSKRSYSLSSFANDSDYDSDDLMDTPEYEIPTPGRLYLIYLGDEAARYDFNNEESWIAALCLPTDLTVYGVLAVGLPASLFHRNQATLFGKIPDCYQIDPAMPHDPKAPGRKIKGWMQGYRDNERLVGKRQYPFLYFNHDILDKCDWGWVPAQNITSFREDGFDNKFSSSLMTYVRHNPYCLNAPDCWKPPMMKNTVRPDDRSLPAASQGHQQPRQAQSASPKPLPPPKMKQGSGHEMRPNLTSRPVDSVDSRSAEHHNAQSDKQARGHPYLPLQGLAATAPQPQAKSLAVRLSPRRSLQTSGQPKVNTPHQDDRLSHHQANTSNRPLESKGIAERGAGTWWASWSEAPGT